MNLLHQPYWYKTPKFVIKQFNRIKKHKSKKKRKRLCRDMHPHLCGKFYYPVWFKTKRR